MELIAWIGGLLALVLAGIAVVAVRERRSRRRPGDDDFAEYGSREHSDAIAAAHTANVGRGF
ncbi:hypothetical protein [Agromyces larvae]|uniref:LPXTG cell wall anchor domain-containing protein n=1 Tax=Agromyces larvae TaxID=2929802 RepID=A0ABY4C100_9MICO|nr:hypothetical protein [Agromyces larvae]UOE45063.1 hypothetical protein MTO99_04595 [Agromyces larvae]